MRCFPEPRRIGAVVGCMTRLSLCTMQLPEARFGTSVRRGLGAEQPGWLRGHGCGLGPEGPRAHNPASPEGEPIRSGFRASETPSKAAGPREPGASPPHFALWRSEGRGENGLCCFSELRRVGAVDCCPRRLSLCTMQLPEARFGPSVRRGLADERPSRLRVHGWLRVHGCGLGPEGLGAPNPASPPRRTRREWVSGIGDPQQISRAHGARSSPAPLCPLESGGPGPKTACVAFLSRGALGLLLAARGDFPFAECSCEKLVLGRLCDGAAALSGRAGSGGG